MPRPRTPLGAHGAISLIKVAPGKWRARSRYRFDDGTLRQVERFAPTKTKAEIALKAALTEIRTPSSGVVKRETTLGDLADRFLATKAKADRKPRTIESYRHIIERHVKPRIGRLAVSEATPERLQQYLDELQAEVGVATARHTRRVLSGMLGHAVRSDALRSNPVRELAPVEGRAEGAAAIPLPELPRLLEAVRGDERLREIDLVDLVEFVAGTGCRIGEVLALRWDDVDLSAGTVRIRANVVRVQGAGLLIQDNPKTKAGQRTITVPASVLHMLGDRRISQRQNALGLVFPTILGNLRDPAGTARDWREARVRVGYPNVSWHSFRKTVATALDQAGLSPRDAAEYLGHANPSMTQDVYMSRTVGGNRAATALEQHLRAD